MSSTRPDIKESSLENDYKIEQQILLSASPVETSIFQSDLIDSPTEPSNSQKKGEIIDSNYCEDDYNQNNDESDEDDEVMSGDESEINETDDELNDENEDDTSIEIRDKSIPLPEVSGNNIIFIS